MGEEGRLPEWKGTDDLGWVATRLRQAVFASQAAAAWHFRVASTTISRYEAYEVGSPGVKPPLGYLAALLESWAERYRPADNRATEYRQSLTYKLEEVRKRFYYVEAPHPFRGWAAV
jgi:hypothetical protein